MTSLGELAGNVLANGKLEKYTAVKEPVFRKTIGKTTYIIRLHFNEIAQETMEDKIKRMLRSEAGGMLYMSGEM